MLEGTIDSGAAQSSLEALNDEYPDDLIDDLCLILDKSIKRALSTYSMHNACAVLNFTIDDIFEQCMLSFFTRTFLQLTDQAALITQLQQSRSQRESYLHRHLKHTYILQNIQKLKSEPSFGILLNQPNNLTNACLIKSLNMVA